VIVVAHRPSAISVLDQLMMIKDGQMVAFGPRDEVLRKVVARPVEVPSLPVAPRPVEVPSLPVARGRPLMRRH
jgi:ABC-type protease/lipase transport system fused ATPase/permease subunit